MAKPLGAKARLIREAIAAHPDLGNTKLAAMINGSDARKEDRIEVMAQDVASQKQAMKKTGAEPAPAAAAPAPAAEKPARTKPGKKPTREPAAAVQPAPARAAVVVHISPVDLIDSVFGLAEQCGGMEQLKRLVDRLAERQAR